MFRVTVASGARPKPAPDRVILQKAARLGLIAVVCEIPVVLSKRLGEDVAAFVTGGKEETVGCLRWIAGRLDSSQARAGDRTGW